MDPRSAHAWSAAGAVFPYGTLMGHEAVATVEKVGPEVKALKPGDRVAVNGSKPCGECVACKSGMVNACVNNLVNTIGNTALNPVNLSPTAAIWRS